MFEDFQKQMDSSLSGDDRPDQHLIVAGLNPRHHFLGMTPAQRFFVAVVLLMMTVVLGTLFLLITSKWVPPFLG